LDGFAHLLKCNVKEGRVKQNVLKFIGEGLRVLEVEVVETWQVFEALIDVTDSDFQAMRVVEGLG
jgi:hypothetical protein